MNAVQRALVLLASTLAMVPAARCLSQPVREASREEKQVLADLEALLAAVQRGDTDEIKRYLHAGESPLQKAGRDAIAELIGAQKELERAAERRYGTDGRRLRCGFDLVVTDADLKAVRDAEVTFVEYMARVIRLGEATPMYLRRAYVSPFDPSQPPPAPGPWQLRLDQIEELNEDNAPGPRSGDTLPRIRFDRYQAMLTTTKDVLARVGRGELATAAAAEAALAQGYRQTASDYQSRRAAWIERRFGGGRERRGGGPNR